MNKIILFLLIFFVANSFGRVFSSTTDSLSYKAQQVHKMVALEQNQVEELEALDQIYRMKMDSALYLTNNRGDVSLKIYQADKQFDSYLFTKILSSNQIVSYIANLYYNEIFDETMSYVLLLRREAKYTEDELTNSTNQIFSYLLLERITKSRERYSFSIMEDSLAELQKSQPKALIEAKALRNAKHLGIEYQNGFIW